MRCDPTWLGSLLLRINQIDPNFSNEQSGGRRRRQPEAGLEITFRVDDRGARVNRQMFGEVMAAISSMDPDYVLRHFQR